MLIFCKIICNNIPNNVILNWNIPHITKKKLKHTSHNLFHWSFMAIISQISSYDEFALCRDGKEREKDHGGCGWEPREHACTLLVHHQSYFRNQQACSALCQATFCFLLLGCRRFVIFTFLIIISAFCTNLYNSNYLFYQGLIILGDVYGKGYLFI